MKTNKIFEVMNKNLKMFTRDKKAMIFSLLIPVMFYSIMGSLFGDLGIVEDGNEVAQINIGYANLDIMGDKPDNEYRSISFVIDSMINFTDEEQTGDEKISFTISNNYTKTNEKDTMAAIKEALENEEEKAIFVFENGAQAAINANETISIKIYYLDSIDNTIKELISQMIPGLIGGILNHNPDAIPIDVESGSISGNEVNWLTSGTPGYIMYGLLNILSFATIVLTQEAKYGLLRRPRSTRLTDKEMLFGGVLANTIIVFIQFIIGMLTLTLFGLKPVPFNTPTLILGSILNIIAFSFLRNALAIIATPIFKTPEAAGGGVWIILIPAMMFSGAFFPLELVAPALIEPAKYIPTRMTVLAFQGLMIDGLPLSSAKIWANILGQFAYGLVLFIIGLRLYKNFTSSNIKIKKITNG